MGFEIRYAFQLEAACDNRLSRICLVGLSDRIYHQNDRIQFDSGSDWKIEHIRHSIGGTPRESTEIYLMRMVPFEEQRERDITFFHIALNLTRISWEIIDTTEGGAYSRSIGAMNLDKFIAAFLWT